MVSKQDPALLQKAFGTEYPNLRRFFQLKGGGKSKCDGDIPLKRFVCAVWMDQARRKIWDHALTVLGHSSLVRKAYNELYALSDFDGTKLQDYYAVWRDLGLRPSEIDYAFFLDRATHLGGPPEKDSAVERLVSACMRKGRRRSPPTARRGAACRSNSRTRHNPNTGWRATLPTISTPIRKVRSARRRSAPGRVTCR